MSEKKMNKELAKRQYEYIRQHVDARPKLCIVCGSGLGGMSEMVTNPIIIPYSQIPGYPVSTVPGHSGNLIFGQLAGKSIVMMQGRFHFYEGHSSQTVCLPILLMKMLGVETIFMTNASGGVNKKFKVGDFCVINDHINMASITGRSPLIGVNDPDDGPRFPAMSQIYSRDLIDLFKGVAKEMGEESRTHEGVYFVNMGPNYESPAEIRMISILGGDLVGMSTCFEASYASYLGLKVLAVALVTNECIDSIHDVRVVNHKEVLETGMQRSEIFKKIFEKVIEKY